MMSPDGSGLRQLTTVIGEHPDWSPGGHYIAFDGDYGSSVQLVAASGGHPIRLVPTAIPVSLGGQPTWSPDGSLVAFKEESNLWLLEASTGRLDRILSTPGKKPIPTCWSKDGSEIYLFLLEIDSRTASVAAVSRTGERLRQVVREEGIKYRYSDLSPDGSLLAVVRCEDRDCNLFVTSPEGVGRVQVTAHPAYDDGPSWSPDGKSIAFVSKRSGHFDIWTVEIDAQRLRRELSLLDK
jgi:TolB protein